MHIDAINLKNIVLAACAAVGSYVANALGGWDSALKLLIALMAADYITGFLLAMIWHRSNKSPTGALSSKAGFKGLCKKGAILLMVWVAVMLDGAIGSEYVRVAVILFFVGNEGLSLLENLGLMGVPYPSFLQRALEALRSKGDKGDKDTEM